MLDVTASLNSRSISCFLNTHTDNICAYRHVIGCNVLVLTHTFTHAGGAAVVLRSSVCTAG